MNANEFIVKWRKVELKERSAAQEHFLDLCAVFEHPTPAQADPTGETFCFEKGAAKHGGGDGFADVWKKGFFGWEYKGKKKDLDAAYDQLLLYREALENPPLLIVSDMDRIVVHTNFTSTASLRHEIPLEELGAPRNLEILRNVFTAPEKLKPGATSQTITQEAASRLAEIAESLRKRGLDPKEVAHFLDRLIFCMFAEDIGLLPENLFSKLLQKIGDDAARFSKLVAQLFDAMAKGGDFGMETIRHFNGNLFIQGPVLELTRDEIQAVVAAAKLDWSAVDPSIFGTLFERGMDPTKRSQLGAHYTSREDIETLVEPVIMKPLRAEWEAVKAEIAETLEAGKKKQQKEHEKDGKRSDQKKPTLEKAIKKACGIIERFHDRLQNVRVLDPACGSGNFLYVTLQKLKDLEKQIILFSEENGLGVGIPLVGPWQLYGIEINPYAFDLAQMTAWIGYLQWTKVNGFGLEKEPVLRTMDTFHCMDSVLDLSDPENPKEPEWPEVDFIVGNPPFLGGSKLWEELGRDYQQKLWKVYEGRVPGFADLCCYWFEKARKHIQEGKCKRAGLLATQAIRGGANREVLKRIKESGDIFFAESDREWILDGANVHISMAGFDDGSEKEKILDGKIVETINPNLSSSADITQARTLEKNEGIAFIGTKKAGDFNIEEFVAEKWLALPNPHGKPNSDILKPWINGGAIVKRPDNQWIIDCGTEMELKDFLLYETLHAHVLEKVKPDRDKNNRPLYRENWWLHAETRPGMRKALNGLARCLVTPRVSKFRIFTWIPAIVLPDDGVFVFARSDDYFFGVLHSRLHEVWALKLGTRLETRPRYTPTTCFETFPLPYPPGKEPFDDQGVKAISAAAKELDALRTRWLNPPEWVKEEVLEFQGTVGGPWDRYIEKGEKKPGEIGTVRYPRLVPKDADCAKKLKERTLTNLYNQRPAWLAQAHQKLDEAVFAAYGLPVTLTDDEILAKLLERNQGER